VSISQAKIMLDAVVVGRDVDVDDLLTKVRERVRVARETTDAVPASVSSPEPTALERIVVLGVSTQRAIGLLTDHAESTHERIGVLEGWIRAETERAAVTEYRAGLELQRMIEVLEALNRRVDDLATHVEGLGANFQRQIEEIREEVRGELRGPTKERRT
jgi:hypothetical protein